MKTSPNLLNQAGILRVIKRHGSRFTARISALILLAVSVLVTNPSIVLAQDQSEAVQQHQPLDYWSMIFVLAMATFIGLGVIRRVSRMLHTPLMSLTNAISAIAVVGAILVAGGDYPPFIRILGAIALFASMTNIVSGFLITQRMLKMFKKK